MKKPVRPLHSGFWQSCQMTNAHGCSSRLAEYLKSKCTGSHNVFQRFLELACVASMPIIMAGCIPMSLAKHVDYIDIYNKLTTPISFCPSHENDGTCPRIIDAGSMDGNIYMSPPGGESSEEDIYQIFDRIEITICGEPINFKRIREISPVTKHWRPGSHQYEIVIDKTVKDAFCQKDSQND